MASKSAEGKGVALPPSLLWLADAPLFIDDKLVDRFYDAIVQPQGEQMTTTLEVSQEKVTKLSGELDLGASISPSDLLTSLSKFLPFLKVEAHADAKGSAGQDTSKSASESIEVRTIKTPQRQLVNLVLHYLINQPSRLYLKGDPTDSTWRTQGFVSGVPRALVFLDLPGQNELQDAPRQRAEVRLIPIAAEFSNGNVELLYRKLTSRNGREISPDYPESAASLDNLKDERKKYWQWFDENFSATRAMLLIENAGRDNGRIRWIDFRLPISSDGDTLHLHFSPAV